LRFVRWQYAKLDADVWQDFRRLAGDAGHEAVEPPASFLYSIGHQDALTAKTHPTMPRSAFISPSADDAGTPVVQYSASRLLFKAAAIEPLQPDERFRIRTPVGTFDMSKREFYEAFPRLIQTSSYRDRGIYHFPKVPKAAIRFLVP
jgi:hypothetical protein